MIPWSRLMRILVSSTSTNIQVVEGINNIIKIIVAFEYNLITVRYIIVVLRTVTIFDF
jgi:hypothetical protein